MNPLDRINQLTEEREKLRIEVLDLKAELAAMRRERDGFKTSIGVMGDRMRLMDDELAALRHDRDLKREKLANCMSMLEELEGLDWGDDGMPFTIDWDELNAAMTGGAS